MADELIGKYLGRYHLLERLGEGGMAVVYKAFDTTLERYVAVKVILPYQEHSEQFLARFKREARALARLSHPNILKIFDYGEFESHLYLVMEYIPGGTLKDWMKDNAVLWQKAAQLLARVARALEAAHKEGIIHRDVKPANILMANGRDPLLSDFGIAKLIEASGETTDLTGTGVGIGTPFYMAPEQSVGIVDERSDIYALGVIFYEMVTGRLPYEADTPMGVILKKNTEPLPRPSQYAPGLPGEVENILIIALARDPKYRYRNMGEFAAALERLSSKADTLETLSTETPSNMPTLDAFEHVSPPQPAVRKASLGPLPWAIGLVLIICLAALLGGGAFLWRTLAPAFFPTDTSLTTADPPGIPAAAAPASATGEQATPPVPEETPTSAQLSSPTATGGGGELIAFNSRMDGDADIYAMDTNGKDITRLTTSPNHDLYASWSPDGKRIVYQNDEGGDQEITVLDISTNNVTHVTNNDCNDFSPAWSPDGNWIAFYSDCDGTRQIYKIRTNGNDRTRLTNTGTHNLFPSWSPDGKTITFSSNRSGNYHIYIMNADGSYVRDLAAGCISYYSPDGKQILYGVYCNDTDDLFLMDADGSNQTALTEGYECKNATWSPDGTQIVFQLSKTTMEGPFELYRMLLDKPDKSDWILLADFDVNGGSPVWQP